MPFALTNPSSFHFHQSLKRLGEVQENCTTTQKSTIIFQAHSTCFHYQELYYGFPVMMDITQEARDLSALGPRRMRKRHIVPERADEEGP